MGMVEHTVGSEPTSCVTPAVSPAALFRMFRYTQVLVASSENLQVRQVHTSFLRGKSSFGYSMLLHSGQNLKGMGSSFFLRRPVAGWDGVGDDIEFVGMRGAW